jgi:hypothetical protein
VYRGRYTYTWSVFFRHDFFIHLWKILHHRQCWWLDKSIEQNQSHIKVRCFLTLPPILDVTASASLISSSCPPFHITLVSKSTAKTVLNCTHTCSTPSSMTTTSRLTRKKCRSITFRPTAWNIRHKPTTFNISSNRTRTKNHPSSTTTRLQSCWQYATVPGQPSNPRNFHLDHLHRHKLYLDITRSENPSWSLLTAISSKARIQQLPPPCPSLPPPPTNNSPLL